MGKRRVAADGIIAMAFLILQNDAPASWLASAQIESGPQGDWQSLE
jgi:hypothetical protein